jgi:hypothetical protein
MVVVCAVVVVVRHDVIDLDVLVDAKLKVGKTNQAYLECA